MTFLGLGSKALAWIKGTGGVILGALAAFFLYGWTQRRAGKKAAVRAAEDRDRENANEVRDAIDDLPTVDDPDDELRNQGRLRP